MLPRSLERWLVDRHDLHMSTTEAQIERELVAKLQELKYEYRNDIRDRYALEQNFRQKFEELNCVSLSETEFQRLLEKIVTADVFAAAASLRTCETIDRDDGTPLNYTLVNIRRLVQKQLRGRQPAAHQHRLQPSPL